jgi:DNA-binding transcriptional ArsR family regulator
VEGAGDSIQNLLVALGHPTRRQILREMDGQPPTSPRQISERLDETLSNVSYHFRVLADSGALELVTTRPVRGSTQHFYGIAIEAEWAQSLLAVEEAHEGNGGRSLRSRSDRLGEEIA